MKILIVAAHPDDEILGCGGTVSKLARQGDVFELYTTSHGRSDKRDQRFDAYPMRDFITAIENRVRVFKPTRILTHHLGDMNKDHRIIAEATVVATRGLPIEVLGYEVFSSSGSFNFQPDTYVSLEAEDIDNKIKTMETVYAGELREPPHPRSIAGITTLAKYRGMQVNVDFAEAFITLRRII